MKSSELFAEMGQLAKLDEDACKHFSAAMMKNTDESMVIPRDRYTALQREVEDGVLFMTGNPMNQTLSVAYDTPGPLTPFYRPEHPRHSTTTDLFIDKPHAISVINEATLRKIIETGILTLDHRLRIARVIGNVRHQVKVHSMDERPTPHCFMAMPYLGIQNAVAFEAEQGSPDTDGAVFFGEEAMERYMTALSAHHTNIREGRGPSRIMDILYGRV